MAVVSKSRFAPAMKGRAAEALKTTLPPALIFVAVITLWQLGVFHWLLRIQTFQLPLPGQIIESFGRRGYDLWVGTWYTLGEALGGLALGAGLGFITAALFVSFDGLRRGFMPIAASFNSMPIVVFAPIVQVWLGFDQITRIVVVAVMTFAPMVISAYKGLTSLDNNSLDLMRSYAATPMQTFLKLRLPGSLPYVFSALKVGATASIIGSVIAEFFNSAGGDRQADLQQHSKWRFRARVVRRGDRNADGSFPVHGGQPGGAPGRPLGNPPAAIKEF